MEISMWMFLLIAVIMAVVVGRAGTLLKESSGSLILLVGSMSYRLPSFLSYSFILPVLRLDVLN